MNFQSGIKFWSTHRVDDIQIALVRPLGHQDLLAQEVRFVGGPFLLGVRVAVPLQCSIIAVGLGRSDGCGRRCHCVVVNYILLIISFRFDDIVSRRAVP